MILSGRGGAKSWSVARALISRAHKQKLLIPCLRELQTSIKDSVHRLLSSQIEMMGLRQYFYITEKAIRSLVTGSEFIFKGIRHNATEIKSLEGADICWVEEAQLVTHESWELLIPTVRKNDSEIWMTFNPIEETDATFKRFVLSRVPESLLARPVFLYDRAPEIIVAKVGWQQNVWFPETLNRERLYMLENDPEAYQHVWEGHCRTISEAVIFKGKYKIETFEPPQVVQFHIGLDFGFSEDPMAAIRCWTTDHQENGKRWQELWIDHEAYGHHIEIDQIPEALDNSIPEIRKWPIYADNSRPESISYIARQGFRCSGADKWQGSIEDGIAHLKAFKIIHVHQRCQHVQEELRLYSWKVDKVSGDILPIIVDKWNHTIDSLRYSLNHYIQRRGVLAQWAKLGQ